MTTIQDDYDRIYNSIDRTKGISETELALMIRVVNFFDEQEDLGVKDFKSKNNMASMIEVESKERKSILRVIDKMVIIRVIKMNNNNRYYFDDEEFEKFFKDHPYGKFFLNYIDRRLTYFGDRITK